MKPGSCAFMDDEFGGKWDFWDCTDPTKAICQARKSNILELFNKCGSYKI